MKIQIEMMNRIGLKNGTKPGYNPTLTLPIIFRSLHWLGQHRVFMRFDSVDRKKKPVQAKKKKRSNCWEMCRVICLSDLCISRNPTSHSYFLPSIFSVTWCWFHYNSVMLEQIINESRTGWNKEKKIVFGQSTKVFCNGNVKWNEKKNIQFTWIETCLRRLKKISRWWNVDEKIAA